MARLDDPQPYGDEKLQDGRAHSTGELFESVADGATITFYIENPAGSGKNYFLTPQNVRAESKVYIDKYLNVDITGGTAPEHGITNKNASNHIESTANALSNVDTFSNADAQFSTKLLGADSPSTKVGGAIDRAANVLEPGNNLLLEITSFSNGNDISIDIDWIEIKSKL